MLIGLHDVPYFLSLRSFSNAWCCFNPNFHVAIPTGFKLYRLVSRLVENTENLLIYFASPLLQKVLKNWPLALVSVHFFLPQVDTAPYAMMLISG